MINTHQPHSVQPLFEIAVYPSMTPAKKTTSLPGRLSSVRQCAAKGMYGITRHVGALCGRSDPSDVAFVREAAAALAEILEALDESEATGSARRAEDVLRRETQTVLDWIIAQGSQVRPEMATRIARRTREVASLVAIVSHTDGAHASRLRRLIACGYGRDERDWRKSM